MLEVAFTLVMSLWPLPSLFYRFITSAVTPPPPHYTLDSATLPVFAPVDTSL